MRGAAPARPVVPARPGMTARVSRRYLEVPMDTLTALASFGADRSALSTAQLEELDERGYLVLPGAIDEATVVALRARFEEIVAAEGDRAGIEQKQEQGIDWIANLVDKDPLFDRCWNHPLQLAAVAQVLGWHEIKLFSLSGRNALPGQGAQGLHTDWPEAVAPGSYQVCNSAWMLDDFTEENGATRVVPGSHRWGRRPPDVMADTREPHPDEVRVTGAAGSCAVFNSHLWHSGTTNSTGGPRRVLLAAFVRREQKQQVVQRDHLRPETVQRLTGPQRYLLEV
jgi:ectoine hydroxylase-related dioxygenase (phytanoyl-CoA dioxygenase family)